MSGCPGNGPSVPRSQTAPGMLFPSGGEPGAHALGAKMFPGTILAFLGTSDLFLGTAFLEQFDS